MEFKEVLEQVLDCDESGQEVIALMCVISAYEKVRCYMEQTLVMHAHSQRFSWYSLVQQAISISDCKLY